MLTAPFIFVSSSDCRLISVVTPERTHIGHRVAQNMLLTCRNRVKDKLDFSEQSKIVILSPLPFKRAYENYFR